MDESTDVHEVIAQRVRALRAQRGLSLEALAQRSGVSRSAISLIERAESSPTAVVLDKLAAALGVTLGGLVEVPAAERPLRRRAEQEVWVDPATGYRRRTVLDGLHAPAGLGPGLGLALIEIEFPGAATVAFDAPGLSRRFEQLVWVLSGAMHITVGGAQHELRKGDCLGFVVDGPVIFHNPEARTARYVLVQNSPRGG